MPITYCRLFSALVHPYSVPAEAFPSILRNWQTKYQLATYKCVTTALEHHSAGILTCYPSTTPFGLALGPANPGSIFVAQEPLTLRCGWFSHPFLLLMSAFSLPNAPPALAGPTSAQFGMLSYRATPKGVTPMSSVHCLAPVHFRREET